MSSEPLTFRGLFLRSSAIELIVQNFLHAAPTEEESGLLLQLFGEPPACLLLPPVIPGSMFSPSPHKCRAPAFASLTHGVRCGRNDQGRYLVLSLAADGA